MNFISKRKVIVNRPKKLLAGYKRKKLIIGGLTRRVARRRAQLAKNKRLAKVPKKKPLVLLRGSPILSNLDFFSAIDGVYSSY